MSNPEYHLLFILSEPPIPVAKHKVHRWSAGDVLAAPKNSAIPLAERFVVLDGDADGRMVALMITQGLPQTAHTSDDYLLARSGTVEGEAGASPAESSRYIWFGKVYYEAAIIGTGGRVEDVLVVDSLSPDLMNLVISKFINKFGKVPKQLCGDSVSDRFSGDTAMGLGDASSKIRVKAFQTDVVFQQLMNWTFQLPRFLNFAYTAFDDTDYAAIRDFLKLPSKPSSAQFNLLNCGCNEHRRKVLRSSEPSPGTNSLWRTYEKMSKCAQRLNLDLPPAAILSQLNDVSIAFRYKPGEHIMHPFKAKPCFIHDLPHELLLSIIECFTQDWDREDILNLGLTCKLFHRIVNVYLYRSIGISANPEAWNKVAHLLPKHGHLTREIYLEAYQIRANRNGYDNLRAIGDFCPNLERLDLNFPLMVNLNATEADLPPMIAVVPEGGKEMPVAAANEATDGAASEDVQMPDVDQSEGVEEQPAEAPQTEVAADAETVLQEDGDIVLIADDGGAGVDLVGDGDGDGVVPPHGEDDGVDDQDDDGGDTSDSGDSNDGSDDDDDDVQPDPATQAAAQAAAAQASVQAAYITAVRAAQIAERRVCAEIDYILKKCPRLDRFSIQWTGKDALERFYYKIPHLKALRIWDDVDDATLVNTAKHCRDLERFYLDGQNCYQVTVEGIIKFLGALNTKEKSRLKRIGVYSPRLVWHLNPLQPNPQGLDDFDDDFDDGDGDMDGMDEMGEMDEDDDGQQFDANGNLVPAAIANAAVANLQQQAQEQQVNIHTLPIGRYLDTLSSKHPHLERLCLCRMYIKDELIPLFANFRTLTALDLSFPTNRGLSAVGIAELVIAFNGKCLAALDLSGHKQLDDPDIETLTCSEGLTTLRYIRVSGCPALEGKYLVDEWVHPDDLILEDFTWRPKEGRGKGMLDIGDGWKEQWNEL